MNSVQQSSTENQDRGITLEDFQLLRLAFDADDSESEIITNAVIDAVNGNITWDEAEQVVVCLKGEGLEQADQLHVRLVLNRRLEKKYEAMKRKYTCDHKAVGKALSLADQCLTLMRDEEKLSPWLMDDIFELLFEGKTALVEMILDSAKNRGFYDLLNRTDQFENKAEMFVDAMYNERFCTERIFVSDEYEVAYKKWGELFDQIVKLIPAECKPLLNDLETTATDLEREREEFAYKVGFKDALSLFTLRSGGDSK